MDSLDTLSIDELIDSFSHTDLKTQIPSVITQADWTRREREWDTLALKAYQQIMNTQITISKMMGDKKKLEQAWAYREVNWAEVHRNQRQRILALTKEVENLKRQVDFSKLPKQYLSV